MWTEIGMGDTIFDLGSSGYRTSRDYRRLLELSRTKSIVCFADYMGCRDVGHTVYMPSGRGGETGWQIHISARGTCYVAAEEEEKFFRSCEISNVEFIEP